MKYTKFKDTEISRLGFGLMRLPQTDSGLIDEEKTAEMVDAAIKGGVNYFDTAYTYHGGHSEEVIGKILSGYPRDCFLLATKMPGWLCRDKQDVLDTFEKQLSKCRVEFFDFYLIHDIEDSYWEDYKKARVFDAMLEEKAAGRIKYLGASFHCTPELLDDILTDYGQVLDFIQLQINYHDWEYDHGKDFYELAKKHDLPIIVMEPLRGGMLARLTDNATAIFRANNPNHSNAYYALKYAEELDGVITVLSGMSDIENLQENIETFSSPAMAKEDYKAINQVALELKNNYLIPCTACNYCYECPESIDIKEIFAVYNDAASKGFVDVWNKLSDTYYNLETKADMCIECGTCQSRCPQHIEIIDQLKKVEVAFKKLKAFGN